MKVPRRYSSFFILTFLTLLGGVLLASWWSVGWGFLIIGGGILGLASRGIIGQRRFLRRASSADGIVIGHKENSTEERTVWYPIVRYTLPNGQEMTFQSRGYNSLNPLPVSTRVTVLYDPDHPETAIINRPTEKVGGYLGFFLGLIFLVLAIFMIVFHVHVPFTGPEVSF